MTAKGVNFQSGSVRYSIYGLSVCLLPWLFISLDASPVPSMSVYNNSMYVSLSVLAVCVCVCFTVTLHEGGTPHMYILYVMCFQHQHIHFEL